MSGKPLWKVLYILLKYNQRLVIYPHGFESLLDAQRVVHVPTRYGMPYENVELTTADKVKLRCYLIRKDNGEHASARGTIVNFHGNAMNHGDTLPSLLELYREDFNVFSLEYRGYGESDGLPSESGLINDAQAAIDYIVSDSILSKLPIIIYGQSLGGAVAIDVTYRNKDKISALIIENTFTSTPHFLQTKVPYHLGYPLSLFCTQRWNSAYKMARIPPTIPILMLSGLADEVIPCELMQQLWSIASTRGKQKNKKDVYVPPQKDVFKTFEGRGHNDTSDTPRYWNIIRKFLDDTLGPKRVHSVKAVIRPVDLPEEQVDSTEDPEADYETRRPRYLRTQQELRERIDELEVELADVNLNTPERNEELRRTKKAYEEHKSLVDELDAIKLKEGDRVSRNPPVEENNS